MVSSRLVDSPPSSQISEIGDLPPRLFAAGEEPKGIRVTAYQKSWYIPAILNPLSVDEIEFLQNSPFGKFISLAEEPTFSGRFGRFLMSRQLKTKKKHETWFLFAGVPVRFSLREFGIVTGLSCGKYPKTSKKRMRKNISETPYWPSLFGKLESVTVLSVIKMLKKRTVTDRDTRIKYACLAIISAVLLPSSHYPKISKDHVELIKNLDEFFAYPWGRLSFDMLMSSIKERDEISLSQDTVAVPGFGLAIQLVMTAAVPALTEVVEEKSKDSETSDDEEEDGEKVGDRSPVTISLHPGHARELDSNATTPVKSIIEGEVDDSALSWSDEEDDGNVQTMLDLIESGHTFKKEMFKGGATKADVNRMREEAKAKKLLQEKQAKRKKKATDAVTSEPAVHSSQFASLVAEEMKGEFLKLHEEIKISRLSALQLKSAFQQFKASVNQEISSKIEHAKCEIITTLKKFITDTMKQASSPSGSQRQYLHKTRRKVHTKVALPAVSTPVGVRNVLPDDHIVAQDTGAGKDRSSSPAGITRDEEECDVHDVQDDATKRDNVVNKTFVVGEDDETDVDVQNNTYEINLTDTSYSFQLTQEERENTVDDHAAKGLTSVGCGMVETEQASGGAANQTEEDFMMPSFSIGMTQEEKEIALRRLMAERLQGGEINCSMPSFSIGLTQEERRAQLAKEMESAKNMETSVDVVSNECRQTKRLRTVPPSILGEYNCDTPILHKTRESQLSSTIDGGNEDMCKKFGQLLVHKPYPFPIKAAGEEVYTYEICEIGERKSYLPPKIVDVLMRYTKTVFTDSAASAGFFDSEFVPSLLKNYSKFSKLQKKGSYQFSNDLVHYFGPVNCIVSDPNWFYFPYNMDQKYWIGLCVDCTNRVLLVLDCNVVFRTESSMRREITPIAEMFPYLLKQSGRKLSVREVRPLAVERPKCVPQNVIPTDSGVTSVLLMQSHAIGGAEVCKCITPESIEKESKRLAVMVYEKYHKLL